MSLLNELTNLFGQCKALWVSNGCKLLLLEFFNGVLLVSQIQLGADQDDGCGRAVVPHLWVPLGGRRVHKE